MADKKISQLGATTTPVNADLFAIVQSGVTKKITYQNLVAAIVADISLDLNQVLTNGNITGGKNIVVTNGDVFKSTDNKGGLAIGTGGYVELSSSGFDATESFCYLDSTEAALYSQGSNGFLTNASRAEVLHSSEVRLNAPIYKFSQLTASTVPYLDASKNLVSSAITPTELGYLTGASSNLQAQIDALVTGLSWKQAVRVATTGPGTLASDFENGDTIDGVVLATGDRILIKDQASAIENGIYIVNASGAPTRASDMNTGSEFPSATVAVSAGTANQDTQWVCTNDSVTIGVTNISFVAVGGTTYVGTTNKITVTGNVIDVGAYVLLSDGSVPLIANWDAGDFEIKFTDFKAKTSSGGSLVSSGGNDCFLFGAGGGATNTAYGGLKLDYSTASTIAIIDSNKNLISADTATYPSLTELSYIKGLTSAVQTQINSAPKVLFKNNVVASHTGDTNETKLLSYQIAAGTMEANDILKIVAKVVANNANNHTFRLRVNTSDDLTGATLVATYTFTSTSVKFKRTITFENSLSAQRVVTAGTSSANDEVTSWSSTNFTALTNNYSNTQYMLLTVELANSGDTISIYDVLGIRYR